MAFLSASGGKFALSGDKSRVSGGWADLCGQNTGHFNIIVAHYRCHYLFPS